MLNIGSHEHGLLEQQRQSIVAQQSDKSTQPESKYQRNHITQTLVNSKTWRNTENQTLDSCRQRIDELEGLIARVREEKRHLIELTTSAGQSCSCMKGKSHVNDSSVEYNNGVKEFVKEEQDIVANPQYISVENARQIGMNRHKEIAMSRAITLQDQHIHQHIQPSSHAASNMRSNSQLKCKSEPILKYFRSESGQDVPYNLPTIAEVDTQSICKVNKLERPCEQNFTAHKLQPSQSQFPTFEEYMQQLNLDLTQITLKQRLILEEEYNVLIAFCKEVDEIQDSNDNQFLPSAEHLSDVDNTLTPLTSGTSLSVEELIAFMHIKNVKVKSSPKHNV